MEDFHPCPVQRGTGRVSGREGRKKGERIAIMHIDASVVESTETVWHTVKSNLLAPPPLFLALLPLPKHPEFCHPARRLLARPDGGTDSAQCGGGTQVPKPQVTDATWESEFDMYEREVTSVRYEL